MLLSLLRYITVYLLVGLYIIHIILFARYVYNIGLPELFNEIQMVYIIIIIISIFFFHSEVCNCEEVCILRPPCLHIAVILLLKLYITRLHVHHTSTCTSHANNISTRTSHIYTYITRVVLLSIHSHDPC